MNTNDQSNNSSIQPKKNVRRVRLENSTQNEGLSNSTKSIRTRRVLRDVFAKTKLSDMSSAKETLREGLEEPEKDYEGKEL